jgi:TolB-like protein
MLGAMLYRFGTFELDMARFELRVDGEPCRVEPQVLSLIALLVENRERLVSRDEIIEKVWDGRIVSDAAISSRIKSARQALGDDGRAQRYIRTIHRQGLRFVAPVQAARGDSPARAEPIDATPGETPVATDAEANRPSIAVLPFRLIGDAGPHAAIADALPHELITELSRLRWLFVTARGSSFRLRDPGADMGEIGRLLGVRYALSGTVEISGTRLVVTVELVDTRDSRVVWAERHSGAVDEVHAVRADIRSRILATLEIRIPLHEAERARLTVTERLDAWSAYHLGLQHMYRFNRADNTDAPGFSRWPSHGTRDSRARMRACRSSISRRPSCGTATTCAANSNWRDAAPSAASSSTRWTRSSTSRWAARSGSKATSRALWRGSSVRRRSARTTRRASMRAHGRRRWPAAVETAASTSISPCA